jgi:Uma2 family endonuclease
MEKPTLRKYRIPLPRYTVKDYEKWEGDWELIDGIPYALASHSLKHQRLVFLLAYLLEEQLKDNKECKECITTIDTDYVINETTVLRPDIAVVCHNEGEKITTTPKVVIEVVSPSSKAMDENIKPKIYASEGVQYYFLAYPDSGEIKGFILKGGNYKPIKPENDGFKVKVNENCDIEIPNTFKVR